MSGRAARWLRTLWYGGLAMAVVGCAHTGTAEKAASTALTQLDIYTRDIGAKVRVESDYYEEAMTAARARINDLWENEQPFRFEQEGKSFAANNLSLSPADATAKLPDLFNSFITSWARRDGEYATILADTIKTLNENRRKLEVEQAKIAQLRNKLMTLSEAASDKDMLKLAIGFVRETNERLGELSKDAKPATDPGKPTTSP
jgi:hypothetical protein